MKGWSSQAEVVEKHREAIVASNRARKGMKYKKHKERGPLSAKHRQKLSEVQIGKSQEYRMLDQNKRPHDFYEQLDNGCWKWEGKFWGEYPQVHGRPAQRFFFEEKHGSGVLDGLDAHHVCENKWCVNPDHIEGLAHAEHMSRHKELRESGE